MGFGDCSLFLKIAFILLIVALIIQILGVALPYWIAYEVGNFEAHYGLFRTCWDTGSEDGCRSIKDADSWFEAVQAFEIIGLLLLVAALIITIIVLFVMSGNKILKLIGWILSFCACAFIFIGIFIFAGESTRDDYSGAFAITIIAAIVALVAGILGLLDWMGKGGVGQSSE